MMKSVEIRREKRGRRKKEEKEAKGEIFWVGGGMSLVPFYL